MIFLGFVILFAGFLLLAGLTFYILPKKFLKYKSRYEIKEGILAIDNSCYVSENVDKEYYDSYKIYVDKKRNKKFLEVQFNENIHFVVMMVTCFDEKKKIIGTKKFKIEDVKFQNQFLLPKETRGCHIQLIQVDQSTLTFETPLILELKNVIVSSIFYGLFATVCSYICGIGFNVIIDASFYGFFMLNIFYVILVLFVCFLAYSLSAYFLIRNVEKDKITEKEEQ